jgi:hypothetical protein
MTKASKPFSIYSSNPRVGQPYAERGYADGGYVPERENPEDAKFVDRSSQANKTPIGEKSSVVVGAASKAASGSISDNTATKRYNKAQLTAPNNAYDNRRTNTTIGAVVGKEDREKSQLMLKFGKQF